MRQDVDDGLYLNDTGATADAQGHLSTDLQDGALATGTTAPIEIQTTSDFIPPLPAREEVLINFLAQLLLPLQRSWYFLTSRPSWRP